MKLRHRVLSALCTLPLVVSIAACSDSDSSASSATASQNTQEKPDTISGIAVVSACESALEETLDDNGYYHELLLVELDNDYDDVSNPADISGTFSAWHANENYQFEGELTCTVELREESGDVEAGINADITYDEADGDGDYDFGNDDSRDSDYGSDYGSDEVLAEAPSAGQQVGLGEYQAQPRVDTWEPELADYLINPGMLIPGGAIYNIEGETRCSAGHFVTDSSSSRLFIMTAGHCGELGSRWAYLDPSGQWIEFGEMVERAYSGEENLGRVGAYDIGIIEVTNPHARWTSVPPITGNLVGYADLDYVAANGMALCRIGSTDGLSCGNYLHQIEGGQFEYGNQSRPGDSGGAIYAVHPNGDMYAVGVTSYGEADAPPSANNYAGGMEIYTTMQHFGLSVF